MKFYKITDKYRIIRFFLAHSPKYKVPERQQVTRCTNKMYHITCRTLPKSWFERKEVVARYSHEQFPPALLNCEESHDRNLKEGCVTCTRFWSFNNNCTPVEDTTSPQTLPSLRRCFCVLQTESWPISIWSQWLSPDCKLSKPAPTASETGIATSKWAFG